MAATAPNPSPPRRKSSKGHWATARKVVFAPVGNAKSRRGSKETTLSVYVKTLTHEATQGNVGATQELARLSDYLDRKQILERAAEVSPGAVDMQAQIERQEGVQRIAGPFLSFADTLVERRLAALSRGEVGTNVRPLAKRTMLAELFDPAVGRDLLARIERRSAARSAEAALTVGYRNPPVRSRFVPGQSGNPSGRPKAAEDGWADLRASISAILRVSKNGKIIRLASDEIIITRLFERAIKGDRNARRMVRQLLIKLDERGLLKPLPKRRRRKRLKDLPEGVLAAGRIVLELSCLSAMLARKSEFVTTGEEVRAFEAEIASERSVLLDRLRACRKEAA